MATTATHNHTRVAMEHNRRNKRFIENELKKEEELKGTRHIDTDRPHEIWLDRDIKALYKEEFGESVEAYNKGKKPSRQIKDYYQKICDDQKKHSVYEMITGVYGGDCPPEVGRAIVKEFVDGWAERNPNMVLVGAYWHEDEQCPTNNGHCHIDYVPKGTSCTVGPKVGVSLTHALKEMGFEDKGRVTAQMQWQEREKQTLERICHEHGIETERLNEKVKHMEKEAYIAHKELQKVTEQLQQKTEQYNELMQQYRANLQEQQSLSDKLDAEIEDKTRERDKMALKVDREAKLYDKLAERQIETKSTIKKWKREQKSYIEPHVESEITSTQQKVREVQNSPVYVPQDMAILKNELRNKEIEIEQLQKRLSEQVKQKDLQYEIEVNRRIAERQRDWQQEKKQLEKDLQKARSNEEYQEKVIKEISERYGISMDEIMQQWFPHMEVQTQEQSKSHRQHQTR